MNDEDYTHTAPRTKRLHWPQEAVDMTSMQKRTMSQSHTHTTLASFSSYQWKTQLLCNFHSFIPRGSFNGGSVAYSFRSRLYVASMFSQIGMWSGRRQVVVVAGSSSTPSHPPSTQSSPGVCWVCIHFFFTSFITRNKTKHRSGSWDTNSSKPYIETDPKPKTLELVWFLT